MDVDAETAAVLRSSRFAEEFLIRAGGAAAAAPQGCCGGRVKVGSSSSVLGLGLGTLLSLASRGPLRHQRGSDMVTGDLWLWGQAGAHGTRRMVPSALQRSSSAGWSPPKGSAVRGVRARCPSCPRGVLGLMVGRPEVSMGTGPSCRGVQ